MIRFIFGFLLLSVVITVVMVGCSFLNTAGYIATAPARVAANTFSTQNIINSYDGFFHLKAAYESRIQSIELYKTQAQDEPDLNEQRTMKSNLNAMRTVCLNTVNTYNANSEKLNSSLFKDWKLPQYLEPESCKQ